MAMNRITVYEHINFHGLHKTFTADVLDLTNECFNDCISSVKIVGQPWILYKHPNYQGWRIALEEGEHPKLSKNNKVSSLKLITEDLSNPMITVYEDPNEGGRALVLTQESNMRFADMNDKISSHRVQRGVWLLYKYEDKGWMNALIKRDVKFMLASAGEYLSNYCYSGFDDQVSYVYPLRPGQCSVTATILWDKEKVLSERKIQIDQYSHKNSSDIDVQLTATSTKEFKNYTTHNFEFSNETTISAGVSFPLKGIVNMEAGVSNTFTVKKGESQSFTTRMKSELSLQVTVPPRTEVIVNFMYKEVTISVPVELKITRANTIDTETGTFRCETGTEMKGDLQILPLTQNDGAPCKM